MIQNELKQQHEIAEIAALKTNRGFQLLVARLRDLEKDHLAVMKIAKNTQEAVAALRFWQMFSQIIDKLESAPEECEGALLSFHQEYETLGQDPSLDPIWQYARRYHDPVEEPIIPPEELQ